jgi:hypothetical protein
MFKTVSNIMLIIAMIATFAATSVTASVPADPEDKLVPVEVRLNVNSTVKNETPESKINEKLKSDIEKLLEDTKSGKLVPKRGQLKPQKINNLSRNAKIALGVGVAVIVIALIVKYQKDHLFDDLRLGN